MRAHLHLQAHMKVYLKKLKEKMKDRGVSTEDQAAWESKMQGHVKRMMKNIKECEVFSGNVINCLLVFNGLTAF